SAGAFDPRSSATALGPRARGCRPASSLPKDAKHATRLRTPGSRDETGVGGPLRVAPERRGLFSVARGTESPAHAPELGEEAAGGRGSQVGGAGGATGPGLVADEALDHEHVVVPPEQPQLVVLHERLGHSIHVAGLDRA